MLLFELDSPPETVKLTALANKLKSDIDNGTGKTDWTTEEFLEYLQLNGINLDPSDLFTMIKNPPLSNTITNIQDGKIIFKGQDQPDNTTEPPPAPEDDKKVVQQMAQRAMK
jgi:hypothetical protein